MVGKEFCGIGYGVVELVIEPHLAMLVCFINTPKEKVRKVVIYNSDSTTTALLLLLFWQLLLLLLRLKMAVVAMVLAMTALIGSKTDP